MDSRLVSAISQVVNELFPVEASLAISDDRRYIYYQPSRQIDLKLTFRTLTRSKQRIFYLVFQNNFLTNTTSDGNPFFYHRWLFRITLHVDALIHAQSLQNPSLIRGKGAIQ
jgi:hypothetical protein